MPELTLHVCRNLVHEAVTALRSRGHDGVKVEAFAAVCEPRSCAEVRVSLGTNDVVAAASACVGEVAPGAAARDVLAASTCFHLLEDSAAVDRYLRAGSYLVTPGWLAHWRAWMTSGGLDEQTARLLFTESAKAILLLDTGTDPRAPAALEEFSRFVGLPAQRVEIGLERFGLLLGEIVLRRRAERAEQRLADYAVALDTLSTLPPTAGEPVVAATLLQLVAGLCGAGRAALWLSVAGRPGASAAPLVFPPGAPAAATPEEEARALEASRDGFVVALGPPGSESAWIGIAAVRLPEHLERYRQMMAALAQAGHLALENARGLRGLLPICFGCKKIRDDRGSWSRLEEYISAHSAATFSHGLCPDCLERLYPEG